MGIMNLIFIRMILPEIHFFTTDVHFSIDHRLQICYNLQGFSNILGV